MIIICNMFIYFVHFTLLIIVYCICFVAVTVVLSIVFITFRISFVLYMYKCGSALHISGSSSVVDSTGWWFDCCIHNISFFSHWVYWNQTDLCGSVHKCVGFYLGGKMICWHSGVDVDGSASVCLLNRCCTMHI